MKSDDCVRDGTPPRARDDLESQMEDLPLSPFLHRKPKRHKDFGPIVTHHSQGINHGPKDNDPQPAPPLFHIN